MTCLWAGSANPRVLSGHHEPDCPGDCRGCQECSEAHCVTCGRNHSPATCPECVAETRRELATIAVLCGALPEEAAHRGINSEAMTMLGPVANAEAWHYRAAAALRGRLDDAYLEDCRDELHPLWIMGSWAEVWRDALDQPSDLRITIERAHGYLDRHLHEMAARLEPDFPQFAAEVRACRAHLEAVLHDGERPERTRVPCQRCGSLLIRQYAEQAADDHWRCPKPSCGVRLDKDQFSRVRYQWLASSDADAWVRVSEAADATERPRQLVWNWVSAGQVMACCDLRTRVVQVWWPDVRRMNLETPKRKRAVMLAVV